MVGNNAYSSYEDEKKPLMVHVTAPATLPGGYTFEALINDDPERPFTCEVPEEGVVEGQVFLTPVPESACAHRIQAPTGRWKDGLFDCFRYGICHPHLWCAFLCSKIALAQVMKRMQLTWLGEPGPQVATKNTFTVVVMLVLSYVVYSLSLMFAASEYTPETVPIIIVILRYIGGSLFFAWGLYALCKTRRSVRAQYSIPEKQCHGYEDCCCAFWCTCCTICQMLRHTGEYETYDAIWCTPTGHTKRAPLTV